MVNWFAVLVAAFAATMVVATITQYKKRHITFTWAAFWSGLWVVGAVAVWFSSWTNHVARVLVGQQGSTFVLYISVLALFYMVFRLYLEHKKTQAEISELVEEIAKQHPGKK